MSNDVFLGGTCADSLWREQLIPLLPPQIKYFNPVVPDWTPECYEEELRQRATALNVLYTITPKMQGVYSIAEVVDDSNKRPEKTILCLLKTDGENEFDQKQWKSLEAVGKMVDANGGRVAYDLDSVAKFLAETVKPV